MGRRVSVLGMSVSLLAVVACGGGDERTFTGNTGGGDSGVGAAGSAGTAGSGTGGSSGASGSGGTAGSAGAAGATGGAAGSAGAAGGAACDTKSHVCAPEAGAGWTGPVAYRQGKGAPPSCPGSYPTKVADGKVGLNAGKATCKCSCDPATGISCTGTAKLYDVAEGAFGCIAIPGGATAWQGTSSSCSKPTSSTSGQVRLVAPAPSKAGTCAAKSAHAIPTPSWAEETRICNGANPAAGSCASGQSCLPQPGAPYDLCVYRPGDMACPSAYPQKTVVYEDFKDTRTCSGCSCGSASSTCGGSLQLASGCSGTTLLYTTVSGCGLPAGGINVSTSHWASYKPDPKGTCQESTSTLSGAATPTGATTVCCM